MKNPQPAFPEIRCADCLGELQKAVTEKNEVLVCKACGTKWPLINGMPWMSRNTGSYHEDVPESLMQTLVQESSHLPWRESFLAMTRYMSPAKARHIAKNVLDENRALAQYLVPLAKDSCVLDFGCGWGNLSVDLARSADAVISMDLAPLRMQFTRLRIEDDNIPNIAVVGGGDTQNLPWLDNSFDLVLMNGVLEFTAASKIGDPIAIQQEVLKEMHRILKPGGNLQIGIENRFSFKYFLGAPEDHVQLPYIALMPRGIANWYCKRKRGHDYRIHTHSLGTYRRMLQKIGFESASFLYPVPNYRFPEQIVPLSSPTAVRYLANLRSWHGISRFGQIVLLRAGLFHHFVHSYIILAKKKDG